MFTVTAYVVYLAISLFITVYVSRTLSRNGLPFLVEGFKGNEALATSTNHLLVVGFYLINLGFVLLKMRTGVKLENVEALIEYQASGIGIVLLVLGLLHFFNMFVVYRLGKSNLEFRSKPVEPIRYDPLDERLDRSLQSNS